MEFAKYYNVSDIVKDMKDKNEIEYGEYEGVYVCMDTNDFWICRILKGYNDEYEVDENMYLVERNKISIYDVVDKLHELYGKKIPEWNGKMSYECKNNAHNYIDKHRTLNIIKAVITIDDENGLEGWDCHKADTLDGVVEIIDSGYGILQVKC